MRDFHRIKEFISYNPETGVFTWEKLLPFTSMRKVGDRAGRLKTNGYRFILFSKAEYRAANLAWWYVTGEWPPDNDLSVDHINRNRDDDRIANLRTATLVQNLANRGPQKNTSSRFKGVTFAKDTGRWQASIKVSDKQSYLGQFDDEGEAARVYDWFAYRHHGEFAHLNFPGEHP